MATLQELSAALVKADAAGNMADAKALADAIRDMQTKPSANNPWAGVAQQPMAPPSGGVSTNIEDRTLPAQAGPDLVGSTAATLGGIVNGIPVIGPLAQNLSDAGIGLGAQLTGGNYGDTVKGLQNRRAQLSQQNPIANIAGNVAGAVGSFGAVAAPSGAVRTFGFNKAGDVIEKVIPSIGQQATGMTGSTFGKIGNSFASTLGVGAVDSMARGANPLQAVTENLQGAGISAAIPGLGDLIKGTTKFVGQKVEPLVGALTRPKEEASRRFGMAYQRDANAGLTINAADHAVALENGLNPNNAMRGGETVRALARSAANQSPEARSALQTAADNSFQSQAPRAVDFVRRIAGGAVDDLGYQKSIQDTARLVNRPAYERAFNNPNAQSVFTVDLQELMQSPAIQQAISQTKTRGADLAAIAGMKPVQNPFRQASDGTWKLVQKANGTLAVPNLQFWDQIKRNVDGMIGVAQRGGDNEQVSVLTQLKNKLVGSLDNAVPEYAQARKTAASYFGADDALEAGKTFAGQTRQLPEAQKAFAALKPAEQAAFRVGYASELIDKIKDVRFRSNVIDQAFGSPAKRELFETVFGRAKARQLEAYVRVEDLADKLRTGLGNSTTARQLVELGIGSGAGGLAGFGLSGGNLGAAAQGATLGAGIKGAQYLGKRADGQVMEELAKLLTSTDPKDLQKAVNQASLSPVWMDALNRLSSAVGPAARGLAFGAGPAAAVQQPALATGGP